MAPKQGTFKEPKKKEPTKKEQNQVDSSESENRCLWPSATRLEASSRTLAAVSTVRVTHIVAARLVVSREGSRAKDLIVFIDTAELDPMQNVARWTS